MLAAVLRSNDGRLDFITRRLSGIPGIVRTSTSSVLEVVKRTMTFSLPDEIARERQLGKLRAREKNMRGRLRR